MPETTYALITRQEVTLKQLRKLIDSATDESQFSTYRKTLKCLTKECFEANRLITDKTLVERFNLVQLECHVQFVRLSQMITTDDKISVIEALLNKHRPYIEKLLASLQTYKNQKSLDYIKQQWAANLWAVGILYCENELPKFLFNHSRFDAIFVKTKTLFESSRKNYASISETETRNATTQFRTGNVLRTASLYAALGDSFSKVAAAKHCLAKVITSNPTDLDKEAVMKKEAILFIKKEGSVQIAINNDDEFTVLPCDTAEIQALLQKYKHNEIVSDPKELLLLNDLLQTSLEEPQQLNNNALSILALDKAIEAYKSAEQVLGNKIKNKSHTGILIKICDAYKKQLDLLILENCPKEKLTEVNNDILKYARMINKENKVAQSSIWDHKLQARAHIFKSFMFFFNQDEDATRFNKYGPQVFAAAEALIQFYFAYAASLIEKGYNPVLDSAHQEAKSFLVQYKDIEFVTQASVVHSTTRALQLLSLLAKKPELEVKENQAYGPRLAQPTALEPKAKRAKPSELTSRQKDKENSDPNSNQTKPADQKFFGQSVVTKDSLNVTKGLGFTS